MDPGMWNTREDSKRHQVHDCRVWGWWILSRTMKHSRILMGGKDLLGKGQQANWGGRVASLTEVMEMLGSSPVSALCLLLEKFPANPMKHDYE